MTTANIADEPQTPTPHRHDPTFALTILGAGSAMPTPTLHHTAQWLQLGGETILIDCGEGTQRRILSQRLKLGKLRYIFISHLHGDHYFGLMPLLSTLNLSGRTDDLYVFGPKGLEDVITTGFRVSDTKLAFPLHFQPVIPNEANLLLDLPLFTVESIPLQHRIDCSGYLFREKPHRPHLLRNRLPADIPVQYLKQLKAGQDVYDADGRLLYAAADVTAPGSAARAYAFCSDTRFVPELAAQLQGVDLLYHEATFLNESAEWAGVVFHSTAQQAAQLAALANVKKLLIGHFSSRYKQFDPFLTEARVLFPETYIATEGQTYCV